MSSFSSCVCASSCPCGCRSACGCGASSCPVFGSFRSFGFSGCRRVAPPLVGRVAGWVSGLGLPVLVGCASGVDRAARVSVGSAGCRVFRACSSAPSALVARSVSFVSALSASSRPVLVSFPSVPCPAGLRPSARWVSVGSGSWSSLALALGSGVPVLLSPSAVVPAWWSSVSAVRLLSGLFAGFWLLRPASSVARLLSFGF